MAPPITIALANEADFPTLAQIQSSANASNLIQHFLFHDGANSRHSTEQYTMAELHRGASDPRTHIFKATTTADDKIVAFALVRLKDGGEEKEEEEEEAPTTEGSNAITADFCSFYIGNLEEKHRRHMRGVEHAVWHMLMVRPTHQRQGIGSALIRWGLDTLQLDGAPIWLNAQMAGLGLYRRFGWEEVECLDVDLGAWGGEGGGRGYGVHRTTCMLRGAYGGRGG